VGAAGTVIPTSASKGKSGDRRRAACFLVKLNKAGLLSNPALTLEDRDLRQSGNLEVGNDIGVAAFLAARVNGGCGIAVGRAVRHIRIGVERSRV